MATTVAHPRPKVRWPPGAPRWDGAEDRCSGGAGARIVFTVDPGGGEKENTDASIGPKLTESNVEEIAGFDAPRAVTATRSGTRVVPSTSTSTEPTSVLALRGRSVSG